MSDLAEDSEAAELPPKQLLMAADAAHTADVDMPELPPGYQLRGFAVGDAPGWAELIVAAGFDGWDARKFDDYILAPERVPGSRVVEFDGELVAATFASKRSEDLSEAALDYVVCHPAHQGRRLGRIVCAAAMRFLAERGYQTITLQTDDWRLPAIKTYFNLGFTPIMTRRDMPDRWLEVRRQLGMT